MNNNIAITEEELQLIDDYLSGQLTDTDKRSFEQQLATSESWQQKLNEIKLLTTGIREDVVREKLNQFHETVATSKTLAPVKNINWLKRIAVAASIIVGVSTLSWILFFKQSTTEKIYTAFYKADPGLATKMSVSDNYEFERAMVDYKTGDNKAAIERWSKLLPANSNSDTLNYFIGAAQLADNDVSAALQSFSKVIQQPASAFYSEANWYSGLALLKQNKKEEAIVFIERSTHPQKTALLQKIKN